MAQHRCEQCNKDFDSEDALNQHNLAKHTVQQKPKRKIRRHHTAIIGIIIIIALAGFYFATSEKTGSYIPGDYTEHVKGNLTGTVNIIEYSDFQCPGCGAAFGAVKEAVNQYGDKIRFTYKHFPLTGAHPYAFKAAEASECAGDQGKFWEYHDKLFENQKKLDVGSLKKYAQEVGLNATKFNSCLDSGVMAQIVNQDAQEGRKLNLEGTPTFFINGKKYFEVLTLARIKELGGL
ncbi:MAG TPA: DsbA family protein [archaeon]|nr:DsbA family protein [archaeon]